jgi:hypothetical protein
LEAKYGHDRFNFVCRYGSSHIHLFSKLAAVIFTFLAFFWSYFVVILY